MSFIALYCLNHHIECQGSRQGKFITLNGTQSQEIEVCVCVCVCVCVRVCECVTRTYMASTLLFVIYLIAISPEDSITLKTVRHTTKWIWKYDLRIVHGTYSSDSLGNLANISDQFTTIIMRYSDMNAIHPSIKSVTQTTMHIDLTDQCNTDNPPTYLINDSVLHQSCR